MTITYLVDGYYNPADELGVAWDDPGSAPTGASPSPDPVGPRPGEPAPRSEIARRLRPTVSRLRTTREAARHRRRRLHRLELRAPRARRTPTTRSPSTTRSPTPATSSTCATSTTTRATRSSRATSAIPDTLEEAMAGHDAVVHFAAESHVDRSIAGPDEFVNTNCFGTNVVMDTARRRRASTGSCTSAPTRSTARSRSARRPRTTALEPRSPYSASKAGSDLIALSYHHTYGLPVVVTRCSNNFGPYQFPEKVIPLFTTNLLDGKPVPLYGDGLNVRDWLYVDDHCARRPPRAARRRRRRDLQHRRRQRDAEPGARRQAARAARRRRGDGRVRRPTGSATTGATRSTSPRSTALGLAAGSARSTRPSSETVAWYRDNRWWWEPLKATRTDGGRHEGPRHRRGRPGRPRAGRRARTRTRSSRARPRRARRRPTATRCSPRSRHVQPDAIVHCGGVDHGRRAARPIPTARYRVNALGTAATWPKRPRRVGRPRRRTSRPTTCSTATKADAVRRVGRAQPAVGLRPSKLARRARARPELRGRAHLVGVRPPRHQHGQDDPAAGGGARARCASSTTSAARPTFAADLAVVVRARSWSTASPGTCSTSPTRARSRWYEFARSRARWPPGDDPGRVEPITTAELDPPRAARRGRPTRARQRRAAPRRPPAPPRLPRIRRRLVKELLDR